MTVYFIPISIWIQAQSSSFMNNAGIIIHNTRNKLALSRIQNTRNILQSKPSYKYSTKATSTKCSIYSKNFPGNVASVNF